MFAPRDPGRSGGGGLPYRARGSVVCSLEYSGHGALSQPCPLEDQFQQQQLERDPFGAPESEQVRVSLGLTLATESSEFI